MTPSPPPVAVDSAANRPIFIIGTERSGSNLLRLILDAHSRIMVPHPPHIVRYFQPLEAQYGDLSRPESLARLVEDVLGLIRTHIHPWPWIPDVQTVVNGCREASVVGVYASVHEVVRRHEQKARWGCKSTFMVHETAAVRRLYPDAKFIWLYRDPRDVAASAKRSVFATFHPAYTADLWLREQAAALEAERAGNVFRLPYEALVANAEGTLRGLCAFVGEPFEPAMLQWFDREEASRSASLSESWQNTAAPMQPSRIARYRRDLSEHEVGAVESIAGGMMAELGYLPEATRLPLSLRSAPVRERAWWWISDRWSWFWVNLRSFRKDKNAGERRARARYLSRLKRRLATHAR